MRSLLIRSIILIFIILAMGGGLTLASASSEPGMFLYPLKQTTQRITGAFENAPASELPALAVPRNSMDLGNDAPDDLSSSGVEDNQPLDPGGASTSEANAPAATGMPDVGKEGVISLPATAHAVDEIMATTEPVGLAGPGTQISDPGNTSPGSSQPGASGPEDHLTGSQPGSSPDSAQHGDNPNGAQPANSGDKDHHDDSPDGGQHDRSTDQSGDSHEDGSSHDSSNDE